MGENKQPKFQWKISQRSAMQLTQVIIHWTTGANFTYCSFSLELQASTILCINWHFWNSWWQGRGKAMTKKPKCKMSATWTSYHEDWRKHGAILNYIDDFHCFCPSILILHGRWGCFLFRSLPLCLQGCQFGREAKPESRLCRSPPECGGNCSRCTWNTYPVDKSKAKEQKLGIYYDIGRERNTPS